MEKATRIGNACGQNFEQEDSSSEPPRPISEPQEVKQAVEAPPTAARATTEGNDRAPSEGNELGRLLYSAINSRPHVVPAPTAGTSLPAWLKKLIKLDTTCAIDPMVLFDVYRQHFPPPHLPAEAIKRMVLKIFPEAEALSGEGEGILLLAGLRWLKWNEAATRHEPVTGKPVSIGMAEIQKNAKRAMENLLTMGVGELCIKQTVSDESAAGTEQTPEALTEQPAGDENGSASEHKQSSETQPAGGTQQTSTDEQAATPRKKTPAEELEDLKVSEWWQPIVKWLQACIIQDRRGALDSLDVKSAYDAKTWDLDAKPGISEELMTKILFDIAPGVQDGFVYQTDCKPPIIVGLRWSAIERPCVSVAIPYPDLPERMRNEAHKILHIPDPERTQLWLKTIFSIDIGSTTSFPTLWELYERVFWRWADTHPYLKMDEFLQTVLRTFRGCRAVPVSDDYHVILGLRPNKEQKTAKEVLAWKQRRDLWRLKQKGHIDTSKSVFAQKLAADPLLMRPTHEEKGRPIAGSFANRLRRRAGDAEAEEREPLGDEEPGFPGLSMKREQVRHKSELEKAEKQMVELAKDSPFPPSPLPLSFPHPDVPLAQKTAPRRVVSRPEVHMKPDAYCYGYPSDECEDGSADED